MKENALRGSLRGSLLYAFVPAVLLAAALGGGWWLARSGVKPGGAPSNTSTLEAKVDKLSEKVETLAEKVETLTVMVEKISVRLETILPAGPDPQKVREVAIGDSPVRGPGDACVTIVEFSDFECGYCAASAPVLARLCAEYPSQVRWVFKHHPMPFHRRAVLAHRAAVAALAQGKFWEMHDRLFRAQEKLDMESLRGHAAALGLDVGLFEEQVASSDTATALLEDEAEARKLGVEGVPSFFLNGRYLAGSQPYEVFRERIEAELKTSQAR